MVQTILAESFVSGGAYMSLNILLCLSPHHVEIVWLNKYTNSEGIGK